MQSRAKLLSEAIKISWRSSDREKDYYEAIARRYPSVTGKFIKERLNAKTKYTIVVFEKFAFAYLKKGRKKIDKNASIEYAGFGNFKGRAFKYDPKKKTFTSLGGILKQVDPSFNSIKDILGRPNKEEVKLTPCEEWFGKFLFGDKSEKLWLEGDEPNTEIEDKVIQALEKYISGTENNSLQNVEKLYKCKHLFSKWLTPKVKTVYRGLSLPFEDVEYLFRNKNEVKLSNLSDSYYKSNFKYNPRDILESWTDNIFVAGVFALNVGNFEPVLIYNEKSYRSTYDKMYDNIRMLWDLPIILKASVDDSFFGTPELSNKIVSVSDNDFDEEDEIFRFSNNKIKCEVFTPTEFYDKMVEL